MKSNRMKKKTVWKIRLTGFANGLSPSECKQIYLSKAKSTLQGREA